MAQGAGHRAEGRGLRVKGTRQRLSDKEIKEQRDEIPRSGTK